MIKDDTMSGKMSILSMRMRTSPGNEMNMMTSSLGFAPRMAKPMITPNTTPSTVRTSSRFVRSHDRNWKENVMVLSIREKLGYLFLQFSFEILFYSSIWFCVICVPVLLELLCHSLVDLLDWLEVINHKKVKTNMEKELMKMILLSMLLIKYYSFHK